MAVTDYFSELEAVGSNGASPMNGSSTYHTPRASMSRRSSARRTLSHGSSSPPRDSSSSPPPMPGSSPATNTTSGGDKHQHDDEFLRDPRRFTPTLHASLVSEILNLRRELDSKHKFIEDLETSLEHAKVEKDEVSDQLSRVDKDRRVLKRNLQQLENGTLSALEELAKDRDETKKQHKDLKAKLEEAQEKIRRKEEESERTHSAWEKEQNAWETERRAFERRVHITESRLKTVLVELEATHNAHAQMQEQTVSGEDDDNTKDSGLGDESDTASQASPRRNTSHRRTMSNSSRRSFNRLRFSVQSIPGMEKMGGISLADELHLDEEDEDAMSEADSEYTQQEMVARKIVIARGSQYFDERSKRMSKAENRRTLQQPIFFDQDVANLESADVPRRTVQYVDSAVQYTPPSSPKLSPQSEPAVVRQYIDSGVQSELIDPEPGMPSGIETRKDSKVGVYPFDLRNDMSTPPLLVDRGVSPIDSPRKSANSMVSAGSQTMEDPLSPPATPGVSPPLSPTEFMPVQPPLPEMKTISTQTDFRDEQKSIITYISNKRPYPLTIPSITITEPPSAPSSPKEPKLPPGTKNAFSQTTSDLITMNSVSVQTEEIRIDLRLAKLPPHLHPSTVSSFPPTPESLKSRPSIKKKTSMGSGSQRSARRSPSPMEDDIPSSPPTIYAPTPLRKSETVIGSDNGSSAMDRVEGLRKLLRSSILAPAFGSDADRSDAEESRSKDNFIQTEPKVAAFSTPNMSSRSMKHLRQLGGTRPSPVPEERDEHDHSQEPFPLHPDHSLMGRSSMDTEKSKSSRAMSIKSGSSKQQSMRKSAIISGSSAHRSRTPSIGSVGSSSYFSSRSAGPPFPVPDRGSSRKLFASRSEGSSSPTPRSGIFSSKRRNNPPVSRKDSLRKVKSANVIQRSNSRGRNRSRSPPLRNQPLSPTYPPLPKDNVAIPSQVYPSQKSNGKRLSQPLSPNSKPEASRASQGTVVDAIATTMVGEWMWKYVRRRTSFGVPESPLQDQIGRPGTDGSVNVTGNGVRHRRWVWLSPYERAIMWSSKQPASNSALMGKSGRKLVIQSVLDVRDDTPLPKNHGIAEPFNRSILILTPARALKFTAMSRERHYTWLTALSFLAHSPLLAPGLANLPAPPEEPPLELQGQRSRSATLKRGGAIRDSVRIAKDRARPVKTPKSDHSQATIPEIEFQAAFGNGNAVPVPPLPNILPAEPVAEPPNVPRFAHGRKRSLTGPSSRMPTSSIARSFVYREVSSPVFPMPSLPSPSLDYPSGRTSQASTAARSNFLDTVGTIRMEAFIDEQHSMPDFSPESNRRGNMLHSPLEGRRGGMILGDDFDVAGSPSFDPFKDFNAPY